MTNGANAMTTVVAADAATSADALADELLDGAGAVRLTGAVTPEQIHDARERIRRAPADRDGERLRIWRVLGLGEVFEALVQLPPVLAIVDSLLGDQATIGSVGANRVLPGGRGQGAHIDYPYWDVYNPTAYPRRFAHAYALNAQVTILLDDFTEANGATAWAPGTQSLLRFPADRDEFDQRAQRMTGSAGDVVVFNGACWHCAMANESTLERTGLLLQYLPKFVRPMENLFEGLPPQVLDRATPTMQRLLGLHGRTVDTADLPDDCPEVPEPPRTGAARTDAGHTSGN